ncbi:1643_t:CDS:2, partial [Scutellospora calospora]
DASHRTIAKGDFRHGIVAGVVTKNMQFRVVSSNTVSEEGIEQGEYTGRQEKIYIYIKRTKYQDKKKKRIIPKRKNKENINYESNISNSETFYTCKVKSGKECKVSRIDLTNKFQAYQTDILKKAKTEDFYLDNYLIYIEDCWSSLHRNSTGYLVPGPKTRVLVVNNQNYCIYITNLI